MVEAKLAEIPDVEAIEVATEILDTEGEKDYGPGGKFVIEVLNNEGRPVKENAQIYNSFVNLAFAGVNFRRLTLLLIMTAQFLRENEHDCRELQSEWLRGE